MSRGNLGGAKAGVLSKLFGRRERFDPQLIDLEEYECELLRDHLNGTALRPPPMILRRTGGWTDMELGAMRENRRQALEIYERIRKGDLTG